MVPGMKRKLFAHSWKLISISNTFMISHAIEKQSGMDSKMYEMTFGIFNWPIWSFDFVHNLMSLKRPQHSNRTLICWWLAIVNLELTLNLTLGMIEVVRLSVWFAWIWRNRSARPKYEPSVMNIHHMNNANHKIHPFNGFRFD